jgi:hypothetical protein
VAIDVLAQLFLCLLGFYFGAGRVLLLQGDALYAMELALSLEKLNFQKLRELHDVASDANDAQMCDFIEGTLLAPQVRGYAVM